MNIQTLTLKQIQSWLPPRPFDANKGDFGRVLVVGGDHGMPGAVRIAAEGALRIGAGLVTVITRKIHINSTVNGRPELLCYGVETNLSMVDELLSKATVVILGPGLGQSHWSKQLFNKVIESSLPMIIDADALNLLACSQSLLTPKHWILTPHPGEAARLLNISIQQIQADRSKSVQLLQQQYKSVIVLKGSGSLIATNNQAIMHCSAGNPGMASAGMGDLLSGIIGGLIAQGLNLWQAAQAGVILHATAGDNIAAKRGVRGMLASDLFLELPKLLSLL